jgi:CRISPR-associated protein Cmr6
MVTPLYKGYDNPRPPQKNLTSHKGLWFERFFNKYDRDWLVPKPEKNEDSSEQKWITELGSSCGDAKPLLSHALSQSQLCKDLQGTSKIFKTNWHFVTGMGNNHPVENGMTWHPTLGTPYLTGASVKGLLRSWMEEWSDLGEDALTGKLHHWFGSETKEAKENQAGCFIFFDALPVNPATLTCDIMTPHMGKWYSDGASIQNDSDKKEQKGNYPETLPADWHNPIPIPFLVVKQASLQFSIAPRPHSRVSEEELEEAMEMLSLALEYLGAGAKTAVGYGRFEIDNEAYTKLDQVQKESLRGKMKPEDRFADELKDLDEKKLAEMFGKKFNKTKLDYEKNKNCNWDVIINILLDQKRTLIEGWCGADKNTAQDKAYKKLKSYL